MEYSVVNLVISFLNLILCYYNEVYESIYKVMKVIRHEQIVEFGDFFIGIHQLDRKDFIRFFEKIEEALPSTDR